MYAGDDMSDAGDHEEYLDTFDNENQELDDEEAEDDDIAQEYESPAVSEALLLPIGTSIIGNFLNDINAVRVVDEAGASESLIPEVFRTFLHKTESASAKDDVLPTDLLDHIDGGGIGGTALVDHDQAIMID